ncbi:MAG: bglX, partial [Acidobacteria bacterium]|nr:bglX [Acidobacteriota bacterium]
LIILSSAAAVAADEIDRRIDAMTRDERVAQLLFVGFSGTQVNDEIRQLVGRWHVGAVAFYSRNINTPSQLRRLTAAMGELAEGHTPPFLAIDQEGGEVNRMPSGVAVLPGNMAIGATRAPELAEEAGRALAVQLRDLGITMNLAPVLDVASSSASAIDIRSFGADPALVSSLGAAFIRGQSSAGLASVGKHFPGIGEAAGDTHEELVSLQRPELAPFRAAVQAGCDGIMVAHAAIPAIDGSIPATQSAKIIGLLRRDLHYDGMIVTDVLEMKAIDRREGVGPVALRSILAGADLVMVLWHERDRDEVFTALKAAYAAGTLPESRLRASLRRILLAKQRRGMFGKTAAATPASLEAVARDIARRAVTLVCDPRGLVPLRHTAAFIGPGGPGLELPVTIAPGEIDAWSKRANEAAKGARLIVASARNRTQARIIRAVREANRDVPMVFVSLGSPGLSEEVPDVDAYLCAYAYQDVSIDAVERVLRGEVKAGGRLPVRSSAACRRTW